MSALNFHVLLIDDSPDDRELLEDTLVQSMDCHFTVDYSNSAKDGLLQLRRGHFDCVIIDYHMPGQNGLWVINELRLENIHIPIVMLTGEGDERIAVQAMKAGAQEYLPKSDVQHSDLPKLIRSAIERKQQEINFLNLAIKDPLTGLASRYAFMQALDKAVSRAERTGKVLAVMFLDLDKFKQINDTHGHAVGDAVLQEVGKRMLNCLRDCDTLARLGGDEFVVILEELTNDGVRGCASAAKRIIEAVADEDYCISGLILAVGTSIGIAVYPLTATSKDELLSLADQAMYESKRSSKSLFTFAKGKTMV